MNQIFSKTLFLLVVSIGLSSCYIDSKDDPAASADVCKGVKHSFATDVTPIFTQCTSSGCHDVTTPILSTTPYANIIAGDEVDKADPAKSKLLQKPLGTVSHGGGTIFTSTDDADYTTIFCWIKVDAAADN